MVSKDPLRKTSSPQASSLEEFRLKYQPPLPRSFQSFNRMTIKEPDQLVAEEIDPEIAALFPRSSKLPILEFQAGSEQPSPPMRVGVLFSGGPAPGGHNVIAGLLDALVQLNPSSELIGFLDGPSGAIENSAIRLTEDSIAPYRNQGGFDLIGTGRTKIETPKQFDSVIATIRAQRLDGLVIVGGDDSNTNAAFLAEHCYQSGVSTRIIGVPKTIDGDLKNRFIETSFGFDSASKVFSELIGNLARDSASQKKYYFFVKMMGRSASHLTLECALRTHVNLALISEEISSRNDSLQDVVEQIANVICSRAKENKHFGVVLIPEGLLEFIPDCQKMIEELNGCLEEIGPSCSDGGNEKLIEFLTGRLCQSSLRMFLSLPQEIQLQLLLDRDPHGNVQLSKIETERLLIALVRQELGKRRREGNYEGKFNPQPQFYGYEGRCGLPSNFDCNYCYSLGYLAALLIQKNASGYMCSIRNLSQPVEEWEVAGVPIVMMLHFEQRKNRMQAVIKKAMVDLKGASFNQFKVFRHQWALNDEYRCPGPIQFFGSSPLVDTPPLSLLIEHK